MVKHTSTMPFIPCSLDYQLYLTCLAFLFLSINKEIDVFCQFLIITNVEGKNQKYNHCFLLIEFIQALANPFYNQPPLKPVDTIGNIVKDQPSQLVYLNICIKKQTCENLNSIGRRSCEIIMKEKTPLSHEVVCFQMFDFETSNSKSEVSLLLSQKLYYFRGSLFSHCFILSTAPHYQ